MVPGCGRKDNLDAHHILERRLWDAREEEGGYFLDNGASLCPEHHVNAEKNHFPPHACRLWARIQNRVLPRKLDPALDYDKWGTPFKMPSTLRATIKYPSTPHLPFSPGHKPGHDDQMQSLASLVGAPLVVTLKMDGSNVVLTREKVAARNGFDAPHPSFDALKAEHAKLAHLIPEGVQVFGEWLLAKHSIHYVGDLALDSYLQVFGVYDTRLRLWASWGGVEALAKSLGHPTTPVVARVRAEKEHEVSRQLERLAWGAVAKGHEGIVARVAFPFHYGQFGTHAAKFVRPNHVQTNDHWSQQRIVKNALRG